MSAEPEPIDHDLEQMTNNPRVAEAVKAALAKLRQGAAGPELAEMATELLEGRTNLRAIGQSSVYATQFTEATERYSTWKASLRPEDSDTPVANAHEILDDH